MRLLQMATAGAVGPLNQAQRDAITAPLGASLCVAGPGSGKTKVLTTRIAHLIKTHKQPPHSIVAITFTNRASMEMQHRLSSILGPQASRVTIGTFHSFGSKLLRSAGRQHLQEITASTSITEAFTIWDQDDCLRLTKDLMAKAEITAEFVKPSAVLNAISNIREARTMSLTAAAASGEYKDHLSTVPRANRAALQLLPAYEQTLRASNALDFQDLLLQTYQLLRLPSFREEINSRYRHILVDEYQDTNVPQYEIVRLLAPLELFLPAGNVNGDYDEASESASAGSAGKSKDYGPHARSLFCVGDQNQAIYSWRGAKPENMNHLQQDYPDITLYGLKENYRCAAPITAVANSILGMTATLPRGHADASSTAGSAESDGSDIAKSAAAPARKAEPVRLITTADDDEQGRCIAKLIETLRTTPASDGRIRRGKEIAVMYRTNAQSRVLEKMLVEKGIPHILLGGRRFYDRKEVRDVLCFLRVMANGLDRLSARRCLEEFGQGVGPKTVNIFFTWMDASAETAAAAAASGAGGVDLDVSVTAHFEALGRVYGGTRGPAGREADDGDEASEKEREKEAASERLNQLLGSSPPAVTSDPSSTRQGPGSSLPPLEGTHIADPSPHLGSTTSRGVRSLLAFANTFLELRDLARSLPLVDLIARIRLTYVNEAYLLKISKGREEAAERGENILELMRASEKYSQLEPAISTSNSNSNSSSGCLPSGQLLQFLEEASLLADSGEGGDADRESKLDRGEDLVSLMTIHASKGLEFDTVFLTGCEEGVLPITINEDQGMSQGQGRGRGQGDGGGGYMDSGESDAIKEERR